MYSEALFRKDGRELDRLDPQLMIENLDNFLKSEGRGIKVYISHLNTIELKKALEKFPQILIMYSHGEPENSK